MQYLADLLGFKQAGGDCILKELAFVPVDDHHEVRTLLFKPPFSWNKLSEKYQKQNLWLKHNYHGLEWKSGKYHYSEMRNILFEYFADASTIFVNCNIKKRWLERFGFNVCNICDYGYLSFKPSKQVTICLNHHSMCQIKCAHHNVKYMKQFYLKNSDVMEWEDILS